MQWKANFWSADMCRKIQICTQHAGEKEGGKEHVLHF